MRLGTRRHGCERVREWICLEVDGELSRFEAALAERHVRECAACTSFRADVRAVAAALRAAPLEQLPRPVVVTARRRVSFGGSVQAAAAAVAVAVVGAASVATSLSQPQESRRALESGRPTAAAPAAGTVQFRDALRFRQLRQRMKQLELIRPADRPRGTQLV